MENFANDFSSTLSAAVTSAAVSLTVTSASGAPAPNFRVRIDNELILVTAATGTTWTVTRGIEGTTAAAHAAGAAVVCVLTAGVLAALRDHVQDVAHGGTGGTTAAEARTGLGLANHEKVAVDAGGNATVTGSGTFGGGLRTGANAGIGVDNTGWTTPGAVQIGGSGTVSGDTNSLIMSEGIVGTPYAGFGAKYATTGDQPICFVVSKGANAAFKWRIGDAGTVGNYIPTLADYMALDKSGLTVTGSGTFGGNVLPTADNTLTCGTAPNRWKEVFAGNNVINTSDARVKTAPRKMTDAEIAAAVALSENVGIFQYLDAVAEKGEAAREHVGMTVQSAIAIMEAHGLDPHRYGFICHDEWPEETAEAEDPAGDIVRVSERQVTRTEPQPYSEIQIIDGTPTLVTGVRDVQVPVTKMVAVVDESGEAVLDAEGEPLTHPVPVMEKVETRYSLKVTREAGDLYSFRSEQLNLFIARGLAAKLSTAEPGK